MVFDLRTANTTFRSTQCMHRNLSRIQTWAKVYVIIKSRPPLFQLTQFKRIFITFDASNVQSQAADLDENLNLTRVKIGCATCDFVNFTFGFLSIKSNPIQWLIDYKVMAI